MKFDTQQNVKSRCQAGRRSSWTPAKDRASVSLPFGSKRDSSLRCASLRMTGPAACSGLITLRIAT